MDSLTDLTTKYSAYSFFMDRGKIGYEMQESLNKALAQVHVIVEFFQLRSVDLPDPFEDAIQLSEVKKQEIMKATAELTKSKVEIDTMIIKAEMNRNVTLNIAEGEADARLKQANSYSNAYNATEMAMILGYAHLKDELPMTKNDQLLRYLQAKIVRQNRGRIVASIKTLS
jgi:regulator of protease activity HflC (stomatin/prohibitin superfamily)